MAKFNLTLHDIGDEVTISGGEYNGLKGKVVEWGRLAKDVDVVHSVLLDVPCSHDAITESPQPDGSVNRRTEKVTVTRVEIPASQLT